MAVIRENSLLLAEPVSLNQHPAGVYLRSLAPGSRRTMQQALHTIAQWISNGEGDLYTLDWGGLRYQHTAAIRSHLLSRYEATTAEKMLAALKRVLREAKRLGQMSGEDYSQAVDLPPIRAQRQLRGRALAPEEIRRLIAACEIDGSPQGIRDRALIGVLRGGGLRRGEVVNLHLRDMDRDTGALAIRRGKGDKDRTVYLPDPVLVYLDAWCEVRSHKAGPLFLPIRKGGVIQWRNLSDQAILYILQQRAEQAGIRDFSPHDFRRTFCSDLLDAGVDIVTVQKLAGHSSPSTTARYDRRGEATKRKAVQHLQF